MEKNTLIDFHAHILPGMDHGCDDVAMSMGQLRMAAEQKINIVIAAPHFYPHAESVEDFLRRRKTSWEDLTAARRNEYPVIRPGAEVLLCNNIDKMKGIEDLCIENSNVLLLEMPYLRQWETELIETVVRLRDKKGLEIILAHGERYPVKEVEKLLGKDFRIQLNVSSTAKFYTPVFIRKYIERDCVSAFGSDIHGAHDGYKAFTRSMNKLGIQAERIMEKTRMLLGE